MGRSKVRNSFWALFAGVSFILSIVFSVPVLSGFVFAETLDSVSNGAGAFLFLIGIVGLFFYLNE